MNIIIAGCGKVGATLLRRLAAEGHDLTVVDEKKAVLEAAVEACDAMGVAGNCASAKVLTEAGVKNAQLLIALTGADEVNLLACMTARGLNKDIRTIARIRDPEYADQAQNMRQMFNLSMVVNPEMQSAREMDRMLKLPGFLRRGHFAKGLAQIVELRIDENSKLCDVSLMEMYRIVRCRVLVCTVVRDGQAIIPGGNFVLRAGDRIFVTAPTANLAELTRNLGLQKKPVKKLLIGGGGKVTWYLASQMQKSGVDVCIIEKDPERCRALAAALPGVTVILGDCSDRTELENQGLDRCDAFLSMTGVDEMNMISSLYAVSRGVGSVITKISRQGSAEMAGHLNLGSLICPRELSADSVVHYVRALENRSGAAMSVHSFADGQAQAAEFHVEENTDNLGVPLKELKLRPGILLATIARGSRVEIPGGDSTMRPGDVVVVVTTGQDAPRSLNEIFA